MINAQGDKLLLSDIFSKPGEFAVVIWQTLTRKKFLWGFVGVLTLINLYTWLRYFQPAPYTDMVDLEWFLSRWSLARDGLIPLVTYPDNEHRALLPVILQAIDHKLFASTGLFLILIHVACFGVWAAGFARHAYEGFSSSPRFAQFAAAAGVVVTLWSGQWNNIIRTKQTHTCLALLFVTITFWVASSFDARRRQLNTPMTKRDLALLAGMIVSLWAAVWSFTAGLAAIPVLLVIAFVRPWGLLARVSLTLASAGSLAMWLWASQAGAVASEQEASVSAVAYLQYGINLMSGFFHHALAGDEVVAPVFGAVFALLSLVLLYFGLTENRRQRLPDIMPTYRAVTFFTAFAAWSLVCAIAIAASRAEFGTDQAFVARYLPFGTSFVLATSALALLYREQLPSLPRRALYGVLSFYLFAALVITPRGWIVAAEHNRHIALGGLAAMLEIDDPQYTLFPGAKTGRLQELMAHYEGMPASLYRRDWAGWVGEPLDFEAEECAGINGAVASAPIGENAHRLALKVEGAAPIWVVAMDNGGNVVGLARRGEKFRTAPAPVLDGAEYAGFMETAGLQTISYVAMMRGTRRCLL